MEGEEWVEGGERRGEKRSEREEKEGRSEGEKRGVGQEGHVRSEWGEVRE